MPVFNLALEEESQIKADARKMVESSRCEVLVVSLGAGGALLVSEKIAEHILPLDTSRQVLGRRHRSVRKYRNSLSWLLA